MKKYRTEIKWGIIFTGVMILWIIIERLMGWHGEHIDRHPVMTNLFAIPSGRRRKTDPCGSVCGWW